MARPSRKPVLQFVCEASMPFCSRCNRSFGSEHALGQHKQHSGNHHFCDECNRDFSTAQSLTQHYINSPKHHYCEDCEEDFDDDDDLQNHYEEEHDYCPSCRILFDDHDELREHNQEEHWYCDSCRRFFRNENSLKQHLQSSTHKPRAYKCPGRKCGQSFISYAGLANHLESGACRSGMTGRDVNELAVRLDKNRVITNPARLICGPDGSYPGPTVVTTRANERSWNGDAYECILCHRTFRSLSALNAHLNSPTHADKIFRCPRGFSGCGSEFKTLSGLMQHVESGCCGVHRFQKRVNRALDDITQGIRGITF